MIAIEILSALGDNYIYVVEYGPGVCLAIDPGEAEPVEALVSQRNADLTHILATHHHFDHTGGIRNLQNLYGCRVVGPDAKRIAGLDTVVADGDIIEFGEIAIRCIATPGHTSTGVCYYMTGPSLNSPALFTGDTLFVCGCGRLFEGDGETMYASLQKIAALPEETLIYPGHDYTVEDVQFALRVDPTNEALKQKLDAIHEKIRFGHPTVPSRLAEEKRLNPFLKAPTWQAFADLRKKKDAF